MPPEIEFLSNNEYGILLMAGKQQQQYPKLWKEKAPIHVRVSFPKPDQTPNTQITTEVV